MPKMTINHCPLRRQSADKFGYDCSMGFDCDCCGLRTMPKDAFDNAAKEIADEEDKRFLEMYGHE